MDKEIIKEIRDKYPMVELIVDTYSMEILWVENTFAKALGYSQKEMDHMSVRQVLNIDASGVINLISELVKDPRREFQTVIGKNGNKFKASGDVKPYIKSGTPYLIASNISIEQANE